MLGLASLSFAVPWALLALAALPLLWWLLRVTPPAPWRLRFPPVRLLFELARREETSAKSPMWLILLRILLAVLVIIGAAHPLINGAAPLGGSGPLVLVIDDGWAAASNWPARQETFERYLDQAERAGRPVVIATTAPPAVDTTLPAPEAMDTAEARRRLRGLRPKPWPTDRLAALAALADRYGPLPQGGAMVIWLSDGLAEGDTGATFEALSRLGALTVVRGDDAELPTVLRPPVQESGVLRVVAERAAAGTPARLVAVADDGRAVAGETLPFDADGRRAELEMALPPEILNRLARLEIEGEGTAASVVLVDERWRRRPVGLVSGAGGALDQPLLADVYYLERALSPFTEVRRGSITDLLRREIAVMVLADPGRLGDDERGRVERWTENGGVVLWFAGPAMARDPDPSLPVELRQGDRVMGGALSWSRPAQFAPFAEGSPFHGLAVPPDVHIQRQVLARPAVDLNDKTWARLTDGTPLVTAAKRGNGWVVLVHTTANAAWSNLPLSGLFVEMVRRVTELSQGVVTAPGGPPLAPFEALDAFGRLGPAPAGALPIAADAFATAKVGPRHPPGFYGERTSKRALNLSAVLPAPEPLGLLPTGVAAAAYGKAEEIDLRPWLLGSALVLLVVDLVASMALRGLLAVGRSAAALALLLAAAHAAAPAARAQSGGEPTFAATLSPRIAYVITGDVVTDDTSQRGLAGLGLIVRRRTAAELGEPVGIDPSIDELTFFPVIYWPVTDAGTRLTAATAAKVNEYLRNGGTILFDTGDGDAGTQAGALRALAQALDVPPLVPVAPDHVLTKSFYLLQEFPGRWTGGRVWVERAGERINDGVSSVIVGGHDWAAAWAVDDAQRPLFATVPGGERQRELAYRFGINLVMYVLTGNYKADQVHVPEIMRRLGQ